MSTSGAASASSASSTGVDRHLRKIYDCLNIGCNKKAVQEVERLPKNVRHLTVFKSLKSLALIRMDKRQQAFEILDEINLNDDLDEVTLQTMTSCYKESAHFAKIVHLYQCAWEKKPNDQEIMAHLFMSHVRVFDYKRQKEIAMQMYKMFPKKKRLYYFWAIQSLYMQSQEGSHFLSGGQQQQLLSVDRKVCLSLAEKMCEKILDDEPTLEEVSLYVMILRKQNKYEEEYRFLVDPICLRATDFLSCNNRRRAYLCLDLKMYSRAFKHYFPCLIQQYPDQIEYYEGLLKSALLLDTEAPSQQHQPVAQANVDQHNTSGSQSTGTPVKSTSALVECLDLINKQCHMAMFMDSFETSHSFKRNQNPDFDIFPKKKNILRGPFMARVKLYNIILANEATLPRHIFNLCKNQFSSYPTISSLLANYFRIASKKLICYYDMDHMINEFKMSASDKTELIQTIDKTWVSEIKIEKDEEAEDTDLFSMSAYDFFNVHLNFEMLKHLLHNYTTNDSLEERLKLAKKFIEAYDSNRNFGVEACKTEFLPMDNYCLLAVNAIMTNAVNLDNIDNQTILSDSILLTLIVMVETAVANSPTNHQLKLILLKLYSYIGASKQCSGVLLSLDIKHFQIDTLGHLLNPVLYNTGNYTISKDSLETCIEFYAHGLRECFEVLTTSYRDSRYSKIEELTNVAKKLSDSLNATQCILLKSIIVILYASNLEESHAAAQSFDPYSNLKKIFDKASPITFFDGRDFKVLKSLNDDVNKLLQSRQAQTLADETLWLTLRYNIAKAVFVQLEHLSASKVQGSPSHEKGERKLADELAACRSQVDETMGKINKLLTAETLASEPADKRHSYLEPESTPFRWKHASFSSLVKLVNPLVFIADVAGLAEERSGCLADEYGAELERIVSQLEAQVSAAQGSFVSMKLALTALTLSMEFISFATTSIVSLAHYGFTAAAAAAAAAGDTGDTGAPSQQRLRLAKARLVMQQMVNKTEAQLTRLSNLTKLVDCKALVQERPRELEARLLSAPKQSALKTKAGVSLQPLLDGEGARPIASRVKDKLVDSYGESLREIESICRRKLKQLRSRDA